MSETPVDPLSSPRYILEGRVVTMNADFDVIERGQIYINDATIDAVKDLDDPTSIPPQNFEDAPVIRTGDTIYPGLIELHNHLSYNVLRMWQVPKLFGRRSQWNGHRDYRKLVSGPMSVLGRTRGYIEAIVRYVEAKCLLSGVTTSQGIALWSNNNTRKYYQGLVRNVEETNDPTLPEADTRIADVDAENAERFLERLNRNKTLLLHLAEGVDDKAREHFKALKISDRKWAITDDLAGIHCAALRGRDYATLRFRGGSMVWSPLSNLLLYGDTADIARAEEEEVLMAIGSDWSPTGSKNLLAELKVAWLVSQERGGVFKARDILSMATVNAAKILKWDAALGSIEAGKRADFVAVNGMQCDPYELILRARETSITLVIINGIPRYGQPRLMDHLSRPTETWEVDGSNRRVYLEQDTANPIVGELTLVEARDRLEDGLRRLPELAAKLENPDTAIASFGLTQEDRPGTWVLELEHDHLEGFSQQHRLPFGPDGELTGIFTPAAASLPLSQMLQPMSLDPLTVVDDTEYLDRLAVQQNLPDPIKQGLPAFYGEQPRVPMEVAFVVPSSMAVPAETGSTTALSYFEKTDQLTLSDRKLLVDQALLMLEQTYVHLPHKRSNHAAAPVQRLRTLRHRLSQAMEDKLSSEIAFHNELTEILLSLRELHTSYVPTSTTEGGAKKRPH